jgi:hypothetical protein
MVRTPGWTEARGLAPAAGAYDLMQARGHRRRVVVDTVPKPIALEGPWTLTLGSRSPVHLGALRPWSDIESGRDFSGWGVYEIEVNVPDRGEAIEWFIDLGSVHETAEVTLNGRDLGAAWYGLRWLACGDALIAGTNRLKIAVANLWLPHVLAHPPGDPARHLRGVGADQAVAETAGIRWGTYGEVAPKEVLLSGLLGPVTLVPMSRLLVRLPSSVLPRSRP